MLRLRYLHLSSKHGNGPCFVVPTLLIKSPSHCLPQLVYTVLLEVTSGNAEVEIKKSKTANEGWVRFLAAPLP